MPKGDVSFGDWWEQGGLKEWFSSQPHCLSAWSAGRSAMKAQVLAELLAVKEWSAASAVDDAIERVEKL